MKKILFISAFIIAAISIFADAKEGDGGLVTVNQPPPASVSATETAQPLEISINTDACIKNDGRRAVTADKEVFAGCNAIFMSTTEGSFYIWEIYNQNSNIMVARFATSETFISFSLQDVGLYRVELGVHKAGATVRDMELVGTASSKISVLPLPTININNNSENIVTDTLNYVMKNWAALSAGATAIWVVLCQTNIIMCA